MAVSGGLMKLASREPWADAELTMSFLTRVLVLDRGVVAEFDSPANLIAARGIFYGMARDAGLA